MTPYSGFKRKNIEQNRKKYIGKYKAIYKFFEYNLNFSKIPFKI